NLIFRPYMFFRKTLISWSIRGLNIPFLYPSSFVKINLCILLLTSFLRQFYLKVRLLNILAHLEILAF
ncbi:MAG: hypothetical protein ACRCY2_02745, partial [Bombilactobacillus sp.]